MSENRGRSAETHFQRAIELPPGQRTAYVNAIESEDVRHEVRSLLDAYDDVDDSFLQSPFPATVLQEIAGAASSGAADLPDSIGSYPVERELGRGGAGIVYLARDPRLGRPVALKWLIDPTEDDWLDRFQREARVLASLNHPHIATIYSLDEHDGRAFLTMEYIDGHPIDAFITSREDATLTVLKQVSGALEAAHGRGIVHRDLKPANVLVDRDARARVLDFGLAKSVDGNIDLTRPGLMAGTPGYMSPAQLRGEPSTPSDDIFAFGVLAFECVTGDLPFPGASVADRVAATLAGAPHVSALDDRAPAIRPLLAACLAADPSHRPASMSAVRRELEDLIARSSTAGRSTHVVEIDHPVPNNLPTPLTSFVGRDVELHDLGRHLRGTRLLTMTGAGGSGKTRLALRLAKQELSEYPDGVWWVELAALQHDEAVASAIVSTLPFAESGTDDVENTLVHALASLRALVVLDNCEHLVGGVAPLVARLLSEGPELAVLVTSREALGVPGEQLFAVPTMSNDAVALFEARARAVVPSFEVTDENRAAVVDICRRLDGIPLAIELAAARVNVLPPSEIASRLDDRFRLLTSSAKGVVPRHRTLRSLIDWSYEQLDERQQRFLARLSVFAGDWTLEAAEVVASGGDVEPWEALEMVTALVDKSLVRVIPTSTSMRYALLETIRAYAADVLADPDRAEARHRSFYAALYDPPPPTSEASESWTHGVRSDYENLLVVVDRAEVPVDDDTLRVARAIVAYHDRREEYTDGIRILDRVLELPGVFDGNTLPIAHLVHALGTMAFHRAEDRAESILLRAYEIWESLGDRRGMAGVLNNRGLVARREGRLHDAIALYDRALEINQEIGNDEWASSNFNNKGLCYHALGRLEEAKSLYQEALAIGRRIEHKPYIAYFLNSVGLAVQDTEGSEKARPYYEEALALNRELEQIHGVSTNLVNLATVHATGRRLDEATAAIHEAASIKLVVGDNEGLINCLEVLGEVSALGGDPASAARMLAVADQQRLDRGIPLDADLHRLRDDVWERVRAELGAAHAAAIDERARREDFHSAVRDIFDDAT